MMRQGCWVLLLQIHFPWLLAIYIYKKIKYHINNLNSYKTKLHRNISNEPLGRDAFPNRWGLSDQGQAPATDRLLLRLDNCRFRGDHGSLGPPTIPVGRNLLPWFYRHCTYLVTVRESLRQQSFQKAERKRERDQLWGLVKQRELYRWGQEEEKKVAREFKRPVIANLKPIKLFH